MTAGDRPRHVLGAWWATAVVVLAGLLIAVLAHRAVVGGIVMAAGFLLGALLRLVLPDARAGGLVVRSRVVDLLLLFGLAAAVLLAFTLVDWSPRA